MTDDLKQGQIVLIDTMIIIETVRTNCWNAIAGWYQVETVDKCYKEAQAGDPRQSNYVNVPNNLLNSGLAKSHKVTDADRVKLTLANPDSHSLDAGERDLFAILIGRTDNWITCCSDKAALKIALELGFRDRIFALEDLVERTGVKPNPKLKDHYTKRWLSKIRTQFLLN